MPSGFERLQGKNSKRNRRILETKYHWSNWYSKRCQSAGAFELWDTNHSTVDGEVQICFYTSRVQLLTNNYYNYAQIIIRNTLK